MNGHHWFDPEPEVEQGMSDEELATLEETFETFFVYYSLERKPEQHSADEDIKAALKELRRLREEVASAKTYMTKTVEPFRQLAIEISEKYEPCGYYCDENVGHVDHKLMNWARSLYTGCPKWMKPK